MLPQKIYESIRWIIAIVIPAISIFIVTIANIWNLNIPADKISLTLDAIALLLGTIFGISKVQHDKGK